MALLMTRLIECLVTIITLVRLILAVHPFVHDPLTGSMEFALAQGATVRPLVGVDPHMLVPAAGLRETSLAELALVRFQFGFVNGSLVFSSVLGTLENLATVLTLVGRCFPDRSLALLMPG